MRSKRKCLIFDLLWPDPSILEGESEKFVFLENKNIFEEKKYTAFLVLIGSTCVQKLRQFEFLTPAIKISFLFDFCTDVLLKSSHEEDEFLSTTFLRPKKDGTHQIILNLKRWINLWHTIILRWSHWKMLLAWSGQIALQCCGSQRHILFSIYAPRSPRISEAEAMEFENGKLFYAFIPFPKKC